MLKTLPPNQTWHFDSSDLALSSGWYQETQTEAELYGVPFHRKQSCHLTSDYTIKSPHWLRAHFPDNLKIVYLTFCRKRRFHFICQSNLHTDTFSVNNFLFLILKKQWIGNILESSSQHMMRRFWRRPVEDSDCRLASKVGNWQPSCFHMISP